MYQIAIEKMTSTTTSTTVQARERRDTKSSPGSTLESNDGVALNSTEERVILEGKDKVTAHNQKTHKKFTKCRNPTYISSLNTCTLGGVGLRFGAVWAFCIS